MALPHLPSGELANVLPLGERLATTPSQALLKSAQLEVLRLVLRTGETLPSHEVSGEITVQCLEGSIDFTAGDKTHRMAIGDFLHLGAGTPHAIKAVEDASLLVTIRL
jgi:quercetin dioxygenase-like cupin family protein